MKYKKAPSENPCLTPHFCSIQNTISPGFTALDICLILGLNAICRRLIVCRSEILNNVCKSYVCDQDKNCSVVVPHSLSSSIQVLLWQWTCRNEVMNVNNITDTLCTESPDISELYNSAIFVRVLWTLHIFWIIFYTRNNLSLGFTVCWIHDYNTYAHTHTHTHTHTVGCFSLI